MKWLSSNRPLPSFDEGRLWHAAVRRELRGDKTGKLFSVYYVAACSGSQLGGAWGQTLADDPQGARCRRCAALSKQEAVRS